MKDIARNVNAWKLGGGSTPTPSYDNPIRYKGWNIYSWTGWKGNTGICEPSDVSDAVKCSVCGNAIKPGDMIVWKQGSDELEHFNCSQSPIKGKIVGQWLAHKGVPPEARYAYASVPGAQGEYERGGNFDIDVKEGQFAYSLETAMEVLEKAREDGLRRLKMAIDEIEKAAS